MSDAVQRNRGQDTVARLNYAKPGLTAALAPQAASIND